MQLNLKMMSWVKLDNITGISKLVLVVIIVKMVCKVFWAQYIYGFFRLEKFKNGYVSIRQLRVN